MPHMSGLEFLEKVKKLLPRTEIALMTGHGSIETAVQAMKLGAYDYITKPFSPLEELRLFLRRMAEKVRLVEENEFLRQRTDSETAAHGIVGSSARIQEVLRMVARLKDTRTPVLIYGESGTGKELVARAMHFRGAFSNRPFVAVDCGSLVPTLIESELFGYEKGAFTGALKSKQGLFQAADGGTIFLDEVGELPLELQAKLLRVLQEKEVRPVGSNQRVKVDVRVIAATNRDLEAAYKNGTFRKDLYFRLNVVTLFVPALRERRSDTPLLVHWFLERYAPGADMHVASAAMKALMQYDWPGNVRELENTLERLTVFADGGPITPDMLRFGRMRPIIRGPRGGGAPTDVPSLIHTLVRAGMHAARPDSISLHKFLVDGVERELIEEVLRESGDNQVAAAKRLGINRNTLHKKREDYRKADGSPEPASEPPGEPPTSAAG
jgi:DNA-binding NtrC family response regulator